jgi:hypothetical protein
VVTILSLASWSLLMLDPLVENLVSKSLREPLISFFAFASYTLQGFLRSSRKWRRDCAVQLAPLPLFQFGPEFLSALVTGSDKLKSIFCVWAY